jgi:hypothetical protein
VFDSTGQKIKMARCGLFFALIALAGCQSETKPVTAWPRNPPVAQNTASARAARETAVAPITNTDPCASRLHDICEPLFLYYIKHNKLPGRLEELREIPSFESLELICPVSKKPYLYNPIGITTSESRARIICYDAAPSHSGMRWAISIIEPQQDNGPLVSKVIALPESHFTFMAPR